MSMGRGAARCSAGEKGQLLFFLRAPHPRLCRLPTKELTGRFYLAFIPLVQGEDLPGTLVCRGQSWRAEPAGSEPYGCRGRAGRGAG